MARKYSILAGSKELCSEKISGIFIGNLVGPIIHCSPNLTKSYNEFAKHTRWIAFGVNWNQRFHDLSLRLMNCTSCIDFIEDEIVDMSLARREWYFVGTGAFDCPFFDFRNSERFGTVPYNTPSVSYADSAIKREYSGDHAGAPLRLE